MPAPHHLRVHSSNTQNSALWHWLRLLTALTALLFAVPAPAQTLQQVPTLNARVTDRTGTLNAATIAQLSDKLAALERDTGAQIAVLVVKTTRPEAIEEYAERVFSTWKLGRKGIDDGILLLVAKRDRKMRIEVGYGLEGVVTDAKANQIIGNLMAPAFRKGDFGIGINDAVDALIALTRESQTAAQKSDPAPQPDTSGEPASKYTSPNILESVLLLGTAAFALYAAFTFRKQWRWLLPAAGVNFVLLKYGIRATTWAWMLSIVVLILTLPLAILWVLIARPSPSRDDVPLGGIAGGGGGGDSGDFSGRGGSSGGGGASGSW